MKRSKPKPKPEPPKLQKPKPKLQPAFIVKVKPAGVAQWSMGVRADTALEALKEANAVFSQNINQEFAFVDVRIQKLEHDS